MNSRRRVFAAFLAGLLSLGLVACEVENGGDPLEEDPIMEETP